MFHRIKRLAEIHREKSHGFTISFVQIAENFILDGQQGVRTASSLSIRKLRGS